MAERIVLVGGVAAGPKAACRARRLLPEAEITLIDQDNLISYGGCGIPYYVAGDVSDEDELRKTSFHTTRDPNFFKTCKGIDVRINTRALNIDRKNKKVEVEDVQTGIGDELPYDKLVLATGSYPFVLPIPGAELEGVYTLSSLHKAIAIKQKLATGKIGKVVIVGGGAIGLEMAEAFADLWGIETSVVEFMPQVMPGLIDYPFARMVQHRMEANGIKIHTGEAAEAIETADEGKGYLVRTAQRTLEADLVVMSAGVRPRSELARKAGLHVSEMGAIMVNRRLQTSDPCIYAAGDCIATTHLITGKPSYNPLGSLANRQGRVVGDNLGGIPSQFPGVVGSFIMKCFDGCIGTTGLTLKCALAEGFDADASITAPSDRAHFYPEETKTPLQLVFDRRDRRVLGVQGFGAFNDAILARINAAAALIAKGGTIDDFCNLEMAYAPPFSTAIDALNAAANVADNQAAGRQSNISIEEFLAWMENFNSHPDWQVLDVRHPREVTPFEEKFGERWLGVPYEEIRERHQEIPADRTLIIMCSAGTRSFEIQNFLAGVGLRKTMVLPGGLNCITRLGVDWLPA